MMDPAFVVLILAVSFLVVVMLVVYQKIVFDKNRKKIKDLQQDIEFINFLSKAFSTKTSGLEDVFKELHDHFTSKRLAITMILENGQDHQIVRYPTVSGSITQFENSVISKVEASNQVLDLSIDGVKVQAIRIMNRELQIGYIMAFNPSGVNNIETLNFLKSVVGEIALFTRRLSLDKKIPLSGQYKAAGAAW